MDYKEHFEKLVADLYKRFDEDEERRNTFQKITADYNRTYDKLDEIVKSLNKPLREKPIDFIDNVQFIHLMGISLKTAQTWRDTNTIAYSQIGNKIYYQISDIQKLLNDNYTKAKKEILW